MQLVFMEIGTTNVLGVFDMGVDAVPNEGETIALDGSTDNMYEVVTKTWSFGDNAGIVYELEEAE